MQGAREEGPADLAKALEDAQVSWTWKVTLRKIHRADSIGKTPQLCISKLAELILGPADVTVLSLAEKKGNQGHAEVSRLPLLEL